MDVAAEPVVEFCPPRERELLPLSVRAAGFARFPVRPLPLRSRWSRDALARVGTTHAREIVAGLTTFGAVSYIIAVNPAIVSAAGPDARSLVVVTILVSMLATLIMALLADLPVALAPGMGMNAFFAQTIVVKMGVPYSTALVIVFVSGAAFLILALTRIRSKIMQGFPAPVLHGMQGSIGLFIAYLGLLNGGLVVNGAGGPQFGSLHDHAVILVTVGMLATPMLLAARVPAALLLSIAAMSVAGLCVSHVDGRPMASLPAHYLDLPPIPHALFMNLDFADYSRNFVKLLPITLYFFISNFFATGSTLITVLRRAGFVAPNGTVIYERRAYAADAIATTIGATLGSSTVNAYVESAAGVEAGGRTGLTALVVAAMFGLALAAWPLISAIPPEATAPALIITGLLMLDVVTVIDMSAPEAMVPPLLMMLVTVVTSDLMMSLCLGCFSYSLIVAAKRQWQALTPMLIGLDIVLGLYLIVMNVTGQ